MADEHERTNPADIDGPFNTKVMTITCDEYARLMKVEECWNKLDEDQLLLGRIVKNASAAEVSLHHFPLASKKEERFMIGGYFASTLQHAWAKYKKAVGSESD